MHTTSALKRTKFWCLFLLLINANDCRLNRHFFIVQSSFVKKNKPCLLFPRLHLLPDRGPTLLHFAFSPTPIPYLTNLA